jgi:hypothetical protein
MRLPLAAPASRRLSGSAGIASGLASMAILLQVLLAAPLLLRMSVPADAAGSAGFPICSAFASASASSPHGPLPAAHDHAHCPLCQNGFLPLLAAGVALPLPVHTLLALARQPHRHAAPDGHRRFSAFAPRAPPFPA